jgi:hypothetical protein
MAVLESGFWKLRLDGRDQFVIGDDFVRFDRFGDHLLNGALGFGRRGFRNHLPGGFGLDFRFLLFFAFHLVSPLSMGSRVIAAPRGLICRELSAKPRTKLAGMERRNNEAIMMGLDDLTQRAACRRNPERFPPAGA